MKADRVRALIELAQKKRDNDINTEISFYLGNQSFFIYADEPNEVIFREDHGEVLIKKRYANSSILAEYFFIPVKEIRCVTIKEIRK